MIAHAANMALFVVIRLCGMQFSAMEVKAVKMQNDVVGTFNVVGAGHRMHTLTAHKHAIPLTVMLERASSNAMPGSILISIARNTELLVGVDED